MWRGLKGKKRKNFSPFPSSISFPKFKNIPQNFPGGGGREQIASGSYATDPLT